jgi:hypothetical protein
VSEFRGVAHSEPDKVLEIIASITKFWTVLGDEDRDYLNAAKFALEEQRPWIS